MFFPINFRKYGSLVLRDILRNSSFSLQAQAYSRTKKPQVFLVC